MSAPADPRSDAELAALARTGDRDAAGVLVDRHQAFALRAIGASVFDRRVSVDDLKQAGYLALVNAVRKWNPGAGSKLSTYLFVAAQNAVRREIKRQQRAPVTLAPVGDFDDPNGGFVLEGVYARAEREDVSALRPLLARLSPLHAAAVEAWFEHSDGPTLDRWGRGRKATAERFGLSVNRHRAIVNRCLEYLQTVVEDGGAAEDVDAVAA